MSILYRVVKESCYNGGNRTQISKREVLYCGYDREEYLRVYHSNFGTGHNVPGHYFTRIVGQKKDVSAPTNHGG